MNSLSSESGESWTSTGRSGDDNDDENHSIYVDDNLKAIIGEDGDATRNDVEGAADASYGEATAQDGDSTLGGGDAGDAIDCRISAPDVPPHLSDDIEAALAIEAAIANHPGQVGIASDEAAAAGEDDIGVSNRSSITFGTNGTGTSKTNGSSSSSLLPHVGGWTQPEHDYEVPLSDSPKRLSACSSRSRRQRGRNSLNVRRAGGRGVHVSKDRDSQSTKASNEGGTVPPPLSRNDATTRTPTVKREASGHSDSTSDQSFMNVDFGSRGDGSSSGSLDVNDLMRLYTPHPTLNGCRHESIIENTRVPAMGNNVRHEDDAGETIDSFALSREPYSREPSLAYDVPQDYDDDDGGEESFDCIVPIKDHDDTTPPSTGNGTTSRQKQRQIPPSRRESRQEKGRRSGRRDNSNYDSSGGGRRGSYWSVGSIGSIISEMVFGQGRLEDMTRTGEISREEAGGLLGSSDDYDTDDTGMQQEQGGVLVHRADREANSRANSWVPSEVHNYENAATNLDCASSTHSRLTIDEDLYGKIDSANVTGSSQSRTDATRGRRRALSHSRSRDGGRSLDDSQSIFHDDSDGSLSLLENDELAAASGGVSRVDGSVKRRPSIDMIDELAKKVSDRLLLQQRRRSRIRGRGEDSRTRANCSIARPGIPDLHDDDEMSGEEDYYRCVGSGYIYGYDDRKERFSIGRMGHSGILRCHKRNRLLLAAVAAIIVGLAMYLNPYHGGIGSNAPVGPGGWDGSDIQTVHDNEPLVASISQALEEELERRKQLDAKEKSDERDNADEIFADSDDANKDKKRKNTPLRLLIECSSDEGCFEAMHASASVHIEDVKNSRMVSVDIDARDFDKLRGLKHVKRIDLDFGIIGIEDVLIDESEIADEDKEEGFGPYRNGTLVKEGARNLNQIIPVGATMVQAVSSNGIPFPTGRSPRKVCIADTGACTDHPDINNMPEHLWGTDMVLDGQTVLPWAPDRNGHGCHLTGLVAALDNSIGYHGISTVPGGVKVFSTRALQDDMSGSLSQMEAAIDQCVTNDADIIVLSLGCTNCYSKTMKSYFDRIASKNIMVFAAAGNNGNEANPDKFYPASYPSVMSVGAVNKHEGLWYMSNRNDAVDFCAHGYYVYSTDFELVGQNQYSYNYSPRAGTSMAVPQVAAVAALLWSHFPSCSATDIRAALAKTAKHPTGQSSCNNECGHGIVQLQAAYDLLDREGCSGGHPILSSSPSTCACVDSSYRSSSCMNLAPPQQAQSAQEYYSSPPQQTTYLPLCEDDSSARVRINGRRRIRRKRNNKRKGRTCKYIGKTRKRATNWCSRSSGAVRSCKRVCSEMAGMSYSDCSPS